MGHVKTGTTDMALTLCKECKQPLSKKAAACPHCGASRRKRFGCGSLVIAMLGFLAVVFVIGALNPSTKPPSQRSATTPRSGSSEPSGSTGSLDAEPDTTHRTTLRGASGGETSVTSPEPGQSAPVAREPATPAARQPARQTESREARDPRILALLRELDGFRETSSFKTYGFSPGGPYHGWLQRVQAIRNEDGLSLRDSVAAGDLESLGRAYLPFARRSASQIQRLRTAVVEGYDADLGIDE